MKATPIDNLQAAPSRETFKGNKQGYFFGTRDSKTGYYELNNAASATQEKLFEAVGAHGFEPLKENFEPLKEKILSILNMNGSGQVRGIE